MSASSSAASSTLTRSKAAVLVLTSFAAAYLIYYQHASFSSEQESSTPRGSGAGLHRSNAVHRRRRQMRTSDTDDENTVQVSSEDAPEVGEGQDGIGRPLGDAETVVDDQGHDDWDWNNEPPSQRNGQNIVQLLFRVSEDATRRNAYVHRGCQCNGCGTVPIRGIRYRCSNCADFDLCESCEAQGLHTKTHIFYKVRIPTSSFAIRQMQPVWYPGDPDTCIRSLPRELVTRLSKETGFDRPELDAYWEQWTFMANTEWREDPDDIGLAMDRKTFDQCLVPSGGNRHAAPNLIHDRMFAFYDSNNDNLISFPEFINGLAYRKKKDKLKKVFEGFDINGDGYVDRKDFLRMFRSYYVLFKQMHRDMLEGLDDQVMNSTDAYQLLTSRQPLSSAFGRDGRFPSAPNPRTGEGKTVGYDGELEITDGKGVISESGHDLGNREETILDAFVQNYTNVQRNNLETAASNTYWRALMDPPESIVALQQNVLEGLIRERDRLQREADLREAALNGASRLESPQLGASNATHNEANEADGADGANEVDEPSEEQMLGRDWPPSFIEQIDVNAVCGEGIPIAAVRLSRRPDVIAHAVRRLGEQSANQQTISANEEIHERWKRRQFYTDEEEGAVAPADWTEEEDIPYQNGKAAEAAPPSRPISPRSRSSSKVRFAEDTDDFETRSNPSTSSRSVPERWGGMEIPEAEKDAGKEILYQVTQQACNELLDQLFKRREEFAMAAIGSKDKRDRLRHLFTNPNFERWARDMDNTLIKAKKKYASSVIETHDKSDKAPVDILEVEAPRFHQHAFEELVTLTGYLVNVDTEPSNGGTPSTNEDSYDDLAAESNAEVRAAENSTATRRQIPDLTLDSHSVWTSDTTLPISIVEGNPWQIIELPEPEEQLSELYVNSLENSSGTAPRTEEADSLTYTTPTDEPYRDPTLPQFRPDIVPSPQPQGMVETPLPFDFSHERDPNRRPQSIWNDAHQTNSDGTVTDDAGTTPPITQAHDASQGPLPHNTPNTNTIPVAILHPPRTEPRRRRPPSIATTTNNSTSTSNRRSKKRPSVASTSADSSEKSQYPKYPNVFDALIGVADPEMRRMLEAANWRQLYALRQMEGLVRQAEERGGWARMSWEEFEQVVKGKEDPPLGEAQRKAMLDFLGSWIEFCIP